MWFSLAFAHVVVEIFQLILGKDVFRQDGLFQILEKVPGHPGQLEIYVLPEAPLPHMERHKAVVVIGVEAQGQKFKVKKILAEQIGILRKQLAVVLVPGFQQLYIGLVKSLGHDGQAVLLELALPVQVHECAV